MSASYAYRQLHCIRCRHVLAVRLASQRACRNALRAVVRLNRTSDRRKALDRPPQGLGRGGLSPPTGKKIGGEASPKKQNRPVRQTEAVPKKSRVGELSLYHTAPQPSPALTRAGAGCKPACSRSPSTCGRGPSSGSCCPPSSPNTTRTGTS